MLVFLIIYLMVYNWGKMSWMTTEPYSLDLWMRSHNWLKVVITTLHTVRVTSPTHDDTTAYRFVVNCDRDTPCNLEFCHRIKCGQIFLCMTHKYTFIKLKTERFYLFSTCIGFMCVWCVSLHLALERPEVLTYCESLIYHAEAAAAALPPNARTHARYNKPVMISLLNFEISIMPTFSSHFFI